jgi:regulator of sigma E protease
MDIDDTAKAYAAGLRKSDRIVGVDTSNTLFRDEFEMAMEHKKMGDVVVLNVMRNDSIIQIRSVVPEDGMIGFYAPNLPEQYDSMGIYKYTVKKYGFFAAIPAGVKRAGNELGFYIDQFKKILSPSTGAYKGVGGFKAMGSVFSGNGWDWEHFWTITAFFSIVLAFMNLLPIPALDGGHVLFTLIEMATGRKPSEKFLEYAQIVGMVLLLGLMLYANGNDWFGWGK